MNVLVIKYDLLSWVCDFKRKEHFQGSPFIHKQLNLLQKIRALWVMFRVTSSFGKHMKWDKKAIWLSNIYVIIYGIITSFLLDKTSIDVYTTLSFSSKWKHSNHNWLSLTKEIGVSMSRKSWCFVRISQSRKKSPCDFLACFRIDLCNAVQ